MEVGVLKEDFEYIYRWYDQPELEVVGWNPRVHDPDDIDFFNFTVLISFQAATFSFIVT